jgi:hypothetical protein
VRLIEMSDSLSERNFTGWIGGAISSASSGLGEFACGVALDNFAHKS